MTAAVQVRAAFGLVVAGKKTVTIHMRSPNMKAGAVKVEAAANNTKKPSNSSTASDLGRNSATSAVSFVRNTVVLTISLCTSTSTAER